MFNWLKDTASAAYKGSRALAHTARDAGSLGLSGAKSWNRLINDGGIWTTNARIVGAYAGVGLTGYSAITGVQGGVAQSKYMRNMEKQMSITQPVGANYYSPGPMMNFSRRASKTKGGNMGSAGVTLALNNLRRG